MKSMAVQLNAKIIVPISYSTIYNTKLPLRKLDEFLDGITDVQKLDTNEFSVSTKTLPATPTIYVLKTVPQP